MNLENYFDHQKKIFSCVFLGVINYNFAIVEQTLNKYLFHLLSVTLVVTTLFHFKNNRSNEKACLRSDGDNINKSFFILCIGV